MGILAGVADCGRSRKWAAKEDGNWDLNLGPATIGMKRDHVALKGRERPCGSERKRDHVALKGRRDHVALKGSRDHAALK